MSVKFLNKVALALAFVASLSSAKKIVVLEPSVVEIMYLLGAESDIAAISTLSTSKIWPYDKTPHLPSVGTYSKPNLERIMEISPDLVVTSFHSQNVNADLAKFNVKTLMVKSDSLDDIYKNIELIGKETAKDKEAKELVQSTKKAIEEFAKAGFVGKKVAILFSSTPMMSFNEKSLPGDIFSKLGFINIANGLPGQTPIISNEVLLAANPDFIIIVGGMGGSDEMILKNQALKNINAVKNSKVITIPSHLLLRGTPRIKESIAKIYKMLE